MLYLSLLIIINVLNFADACYLATS